ncbi:WD repeat and coiled-coil-containing protein, partial [Elysia marginata]
LEGQLTSISPVLKDSVVVATEISLETLCKQDLFNVPDIHSNPSADGIIRPNKSASPSQALMNLQQNEQVASQSKSSSLVLVHLHSSGDPTKLSSVPLKGVVTPDIILYERNSQCVVVGSNTQSQIHIYALLDKHLAYCGDVQLEKGQRPKGLSSMSTTTDEKGSALLILVGQRETEESALLSPATEADFRLSLKYIILKSGHDHRARNSARSAAHKTRSSGTNDSGEGVKKGPHSLVKSESMKEHGLLHKSIGTIDQKGVRRGRSGSVKNELGNYVRGSSGEVLSPISQTDEDSILDSGLLLPRLETEPVAQRSKMIEELPGGSLPAADGDKIQIDTVNFSSLAPSFNNEKLSKSYELKQSAHSKTHCELGKDRQNGASSSREKVVQLASKAKRTDFKENQCSADQVPSNFHREQIEKTNKEPRQREGNIYQSLQKQNGQVAMPEVLPLEKDKELSSGSYSMASQLDSGIGLSASTGSISPAEIDGMSASPRHSSASGGICPGEHAPDSAASGDGWEGSLNSDLGLGGSQHSTDSGFASVERQVKTQRNSIESLQQRLQNLAMTVEESCCVFPTKYQELSKPETIQVVCERPGAADQTKTFLLDNGRLKLESVKLAFGLSIVELHLDEIPCVLSANVDGYIPIKFLPSSTIHVTGILSQPLQVDSSLV